MKTTEWGFGYRSVLFLAGVFQAFTGWFSDSATAQQVNSNNIILVNLDDADWDIFSGQLMPQFPNIRRLATEGITFTNMHATTPFCGPSRACLVRGQYAHRTGIKVNDPASDWSLGFPGGYDVFLESRYDQNEIGVWMKNAGYRTMFVGKYHHHGYVGPEVPPGWDEFYASLGGTYNGTFMFTTRDHPNGRYEQRAAGEYRTNVESDDIRGMIQEHRSNSLTRNKPFFLYYAPFAPHRPDLASPIESMVDVRYQDWLPGLRMPITPDYNEQNVDDKPPHVRQRLLTAFHDGVFEKDYRLRAASVKSVDGMIGQLLNTLEQEGVDDKTYIVFTSDNGYQLGHHRMTNKLDPYNRTTNVPMFVWGPDIQGGATANHLLAHIDICPTILELAGSSAPNYVDGKSFRSLLFNPSLFAPADWREPVIIENWAQKPNLGQIVNCSYSALRMYDQMYIEWAEGYNEYYDLSADPFQLNNRYESLSAARQNELSSALRSSRNVRMSPVTTMTLPKQGVPLRRRIRIAGAAEDDNRVTQVNTVVRSLGTGRYYDGQQWQDQWTRIPAQTSANDRQLNYWNQDLLVTGETESGMDFLQVFSYAVDAEGDFSRPFTWRVVPLDHVLPTSQITYPVINLRVAPGNQTIRGVANDNFRVGALRVVIRNQTDNLYWNGTAWTPNWAYVLADVDPSNGQWAYTFHAAANRQFWFSSRAVDQAGNLQGGFDSGNLNTF